MFYTINYYYKRWRCGESDGASCRRRPQLELGIFKFRNSGVGLRFSDSVTPGPPRIRIEYE